MSQLPMASRPTALWMRQFEDAAAKGAHGHVASNCAEWHCSRCRSLRVSPVDPAPAEPPAVVHRSLLGAAVSALFSLGGSVLARLTGGAQ